jgi:hypothetical protein
MQPESPSPDHGQIAVFYQRHRIGLVTLVFTDLVDSTALMRQLGEQAGTTFRADRDSPGRSGLSIPCSLSHEGPNPAQSLFGSTAVFFTGTNFWLG